MKYPYKVSYAIVIIMAMLCASCQHRDSADTPSSASVKKQEDYYQEKHRPQFHFSPEEHWMNDPNGMVYYDGEYHLFYQYYPDSTVWGPMHWGHAVSEDLVHWEHLPIALYPDEHGLIFSGSAVIDWDNSSGFGDGGVPPMVAIFTYHDLEKERAGVEDDYETQGIAYSLDKGRSWTKYEGNPVIQNPGSRDFRDPKVIWHEASQKWVMAVAVKDHLKFYASPDLKDWALQSEFGKEQGSHAGVWECPDLFPMVADNGETYWVLIENMNPGNPNGGSGTQYFIGQFDGVSFSLDPEFGKLLDAKGSVWLDAGRDNYAGVTWSDVPASDGRRLFMGWMSNWSYAQVVPTEKWRSAMTIPWSLSIIHIDEVPRLIGTPVDELQTLRSKELRYQQGEAIEIPSGLMEIRGTFPADQDFSIELSNNQNESVTLNFQAVKRQFTFDRTKAGDDSFSADFSGVHSVTRLAGDDTIELIAYLDHASIELFLDEGTNVFSEIFFPTEPFNRLQITGEAQAVQLYELQGIW